MPPTCHLSEHRKRRKGRCPSCTKCKLCPVESDQCKAHHIGEGNPEKQAAAIRKKKRRKSGGTPERDAARGGVLRKLQDAMRVLGCDEDEVQPWPMSLKLPLETLDEAASNIVKLLVDLIVSVTGDTATETERQQTLLRVAGPLRVTEHNIYTIAESNELTDNLTALAVDGNARTIRYAKSVICQSLSWARSRDVLKKATQDANDAVPLGEHGYSSRRVDYAVLKAGNDPEASLKYVRLKKEDVVNALEFIQSNCDLSWRTGHTKSKSIGSLKIEIPRLKRHLTMEYMQREYLRWVADHDLTPIGRTEFHSLLRLITVEVKEITGSSYYYTDGVIDSFKTITELLSRLKKIAHPGIVQYTERLASRATSVQYFLKYELRSHLDTSTEGCSEGFHCLRHALNGVCVHAHNWSCSSCSSLDQLCDEICDHIEQVRDLAREHDDELLSMIACMRRVGGQVFRYVKHVARGLWQHARITDAIIEVASDCASRESVLFVDLDHKQKILGRKLVENQIEYFGKVGMSLLGAMVMSPTSVTSPNDSPASTNDPPASTNASPASTIDPPTSENDPPMSANDPPTSTNGPPPAFPNAASATTPDSVSVDLKFIDMVVSGGAQDMFQVFSCLEALIQHIHLSSPHATSMVLLSDNAGVFSGGDWIPWVVKLARKYPFLRVARYMNTEAQTGRDMLDAHFSFLNLKIDAYVRKGNSVQNPDELFAAITDDDGVANTSTILLSVDKDKASLFNSSKKSFNSKIKTGVRRVHDVVYEEACKEICDGATPLCRLYTNSGVPNSIMTSLLDQRKATTTNARFPKFVCSRTHAELILASAVDKTLSSPPHSNPQTEDNAALHTAQATLDNAETLTGVKVLKKFSSTRKSALVKTVHLALSTESNTGESSPVDASEGSPIQVLRCSRCAKRYVNADAHGEHERSCTKDVVRSKDELIADALQQFFTSSKQTFAEMRARSTSLCADTVDVSSRRSRQNWAEKETVNEFAVFTSMIREEILQFFTTERKSDRKVQPQDVRAHLLESVVSSTDWEAKFLLSEQRLKTELSRLANKK